ncbi:MAG: radical SAM protein [Bacteroidia bacterium]|nr:radical SAM protein [Bacteroidia bacterium]
MSDYTGINSSWILSHRSSKNKVDPFKPYAWLVEKERSASGNIEDTGIIFLTNRECQYRCLMCDLWKNTTDESVPPGAITRQIEWALEKMPGIRNLKIYNSGSFFDELAIAESEYKNIASLVGSFDSVIVECHPKLIDEKCLRFRDLIKTDLQIAIGLETVNREILMRLNKKVTIEDFERSVKYLTANRILSRAFILLRPPFMTEEEGVFWAKKSIGFAFDTGTECCTVIPVRGGNGAMEELARNGHFSPPQLTSLEEVLEYGIGLKRGRVFADTWDLGLFSKCDRCLDLRTERITKMNLSQTILDPVGCECR